ncbi:MAG TPA: deoxynucleoside kinase [Candidatus Kapabacteria bacterium]|jgi:deoxyadenosine/deoxycytidine kinase|nr:deoxynucleoside kinase [Candidatus Kapabacteria bacterium]
MPEDDSPRYIAVEGPIGAGKTTLAEILAMRLRSQLILERYEENPFLPGFYEDRRRLAFQTQVFFLLSRYRQQQELFQTDLFYNSVVSDYVFAKDRIFAAINLSEDELKLYDQIEYALNKTVPTPDVVIYLQASVAQLEDGILRRGRTFEKKISREYLTSVVEAYNEYFFHYRDTRLIVVDAGSIDFLDHPQHVEMLLKTIHRSPHPPVEYISLAEPSAVPGTLFSGT